MSSRTDSILRLNDICKGLRGQLVIHASVELHIALNDTLNDQTLAFLVLISGLTMPAS